MKGSNPRPALRRECIDSYSPRLTLTNPLSLSTSYLAKVFSAAVSRHEVQTDKLLKLSLQVSIEVFMGTKSFKPYQSDFIIACVAKKVKLTLAPELIDPEL